MALVLAVICCAACGYFAAALGLRGRACSLEDALLRASLAVGYGLGLFSVIFFLARLLGFSRLLLIDVSVAVLLASAFFIVRDRAAAGPSPRCDAFGSSRGLRHFVKCSFVIALCAAVGSVVLPAIAHPHGEGWDAFAIWNLHARFLFRSSSDWRAGFSPLIPWSHPDYPLLLPASVAHFWSVLGHESTFVPAAIGIAFMFATVGVLFSSLAVLRGHTTAALAGLTLLSTPFFVEQGSSQYADVPLSFFFLTTMSLLHLYDDCAAPDARPRGLLLLAGVAAGFAAWTKNEGMLFLCAFVVAQLIVRIIPRRSQTASKGLSVQPDSIWSWNASAAFLLAALPILLLVLWFKHLVGFPNEIFVNQATMIHKLLDPARYWAITRWYAKEFLRFGQWWPVPTTLLMIFLRFMLPGKRSKHSPITRAAIWTLTLTLAGYVAIYVITPYDLYWHLRFSLNRLFLQLWPCVVLLFFLRTPLATAAKVSK